MSKISFNHDFKEQEGVFPSKLRELIIKHFLKGDSEREIAKKVLISRDSVHYIRAQYKSMKYIRNLMGQGRR